jgi:CHAD domain-containing protein/CYTH domain-containing protein
VARFPDTLLDEGEDRGVRLVALGLLADAAAQRERLSQPDDPEALHDFRVAVRRLRSWLRLHGGALGKSAPRKAQKLLARLATATNRSRDTEVFVQWLEDEKATLNDRQKVGANWLLRRLADEKGRADADVVAEVARDFERAHERLSDRLPHFRVRMHVHEGAREATFAAAMAVLVRSQAALLKRRLDALRDVHDDQAAHRARIVGKRLRYVLEPVIPHVPGGAEVLAQLKALQDALGDFHDAHVWQRAVAAALTRAERDEARARATESATPVPDGSPAAPEGKRRSYRRTPRAGLVALIEHLQVRARDRFEGVQRDWSGPALHPLLEGVEAIAVVLDARARSGVEIERKYLLRAMPATMPPANVKEIDQGYLPGTRLIERVRRVREGDEERYYRTVKLGAGLVRTEVEEECARELFEALWPLTEGRRVRKRRHVVDDGAWRWELDEFTDRALVLAEVELPSADLTAESPAWLLSVMEREVTDDPAYVNANLAR